MPSQIHTPGQAIISQYSAAMVVGLGATGYSVVRYLRARGLQVSVMDSSESPAFARQLSQAYPEVVTHFGTFTTELLDNVRLIVTSPGVAMNESVLRKAKSAGAHIIGDIELFLQENSKPVIAITGSNGKSTVTTLVGKMCQAGGFKPIVAGNIGLPALDCLTDEARYDIAVLELSSFQLETTTHMPAESAAILNVSADHMDRYESMGDYVLAKARVLRGAKRAILPRHDEQLRHIMPVNVDTQLSFDLDEPGNGSEFGLKRQSNYRWLMKGSSRLMQLRTIPLIGLHNVKNVLSAFALVDFLKIPLSQLVGAVSEFNGLPHRMQTVGSLNGVTFVNDSKATNVGATSTALRNMENEVIWIAGGQGKGADFSALRAAVTGNIKRLIVLGEDAKEIEQSLTGLLPIQHAGDMREAIEIAGQHLTNNSIVLLSPACASLDMYQSFEHRGDHFTHEARAWLERGVA